MLTKNAEQKCVRVVCVCVHAFVCEMKREGGGRDRRTFRELTVI